MSKSIKRKRLPGLSSNLTITPYFSSGRRHPNPEFAQLNCGASRTQTIEIGMNTKFVFLIVLLQLYICSSNAAPHGMALDGIVLKNGGMQTIEKQKLRSCICPAVYSPVCCRKGGNTYTASNSCECTCRNGATVVDGDCGLTFRPVLKRLEKLLK